MMALFEANDINVEVVTSLDYVGIWDTMRYYIIDAQAD